MKYKCKKCARDFPLPARIEEMTKDETKEFDFASPVTKSVYKTVVKYCCPFCESIDLEELQ